MIKVKSYPLLLIKRSVYHAIKSINEAPTLYSIPSARTSTGRMQGWLIYYYGGNQQLTLSDSINTPILLSPKDVMIKVSASSINPIDIRRRGKILKTF